MCQKLSNHPLTEICTALKKEQKCLKLEFLLARSENVPLYAWRYHTITRPNDDIISRVQWQLDKLERPFWEYPPQ